MARTQAILPKSLANRPQSKTADPCHRLSHSTNGLPLAIRAGTWPFCRLCPGAPGRAWPRAPQGRTSSRSSRTHRSLLLLGPVALSTRCRTGGCWGGMVSTCSAAEQPLWSSAVSMSFCFSSCKAGIWGPLPQASRENEGIPLFIPEPGIRPSRTLTAQASLCSSYLFPGCLSFPGSCLCPFFCFPRPRYFLQSRHFWAYITCTDTTF